MHSTIEEQNEYIETLVQLRRQSVVWLGAEAQDQAEAQVRHEWSVFPPTPWKIQAQRQIAAWREEIRDCCNGHLQQILGQKISHLEGELACAA